MNVRSLIDTFATAYQYEIGIAKVMIANLLAIVLGAGAVSVGLEKTAGSLLWMAVGVILVLAGLSGIMNFAYREVLSNA